MMKLFVIFFIFLKLYTRRKNLILLISLSSTTFAWTCFEITAINVSILLSYEYDRNRKN